MSLIEAIEMIKASGGKIIFEPQTPEPVIDNTETLTTKEACNHFKISPSNLKELKSKIKHSQPQTSNGKGKIRWNKQSIADVLNIPAEYTTDPASQHLAGLQLGTIPGIKERRRAKP